MTESHTASIPGIILDAEGIRDEVATGQNQYDLSDDQMQKLESLSDDQINTVINEEIDDDFWQMYDQLRSRVIRTITNED